MPYQRKTTRPYRRRRPARTTMVRRPLYTRRMVRRNPTFTEMAKMFPIAGNNGGIFTCSMDQIDQVAQYQSLYRQYRINWVSFLVIPDYNSYDGTVPPVAGGTGMPRIAYAITTTPGALAPINEQSILDNNGAKVQALVTKWKASCKPMPTQTNGVVGAGNALMRYKSAPWLNFQTAPGSINPPHFGVSYWISEVVSTVPHNYSVFTKINFSVRDPL